MIPQLDRTRFLEELDRMVMRDKRGAIDDMLQVLRENGVIKTAYSTASIDDRWMMRDAESYTASLKRQAVDQLSHFIDYEGAVKFSEDRRARPMPQLVASIDIVVTK